MVTVLQMCVCEDCEYNIDGGGCAKGGIVIGRDGRCMREEEKPMTMRCYQVLKDKPSSETIGEALPLMVSITAILLNLYVIATAEEAVTKIMAGVAVVLVLGVVTIGMNPVWWRD